MLISLSILDSQPTLLPCRIAQLYNNYYLRTSGLNFLNEAFVFYEAIHARQVSGQHTAAQCATMSQDRAHSVSGEQAWQNVPPTCGPTALCALQYFPADSKDPQVLVKHLRYQARFVLVCLLLNRREVTCHCLSLPALQLMPDLAQHIPSLLVHELIAVCPSCTVHRPCIFDPLCIFECICAGSFRLLKVSSSAGCLGTLRGVQDANRWV